MVRLTPLCVLLLLASCSGPQASDGAQTPQLDDTGGTAPVEDCFDDRGRIKDLSVELTANPTVIRVSWTTVEAFPTFIQYTTEEQGSFDTPIVESTTTNEPHEELLRGLRPQTEFQIQPMVVDEGVYYCPPSQSIETGPLPPELPTLERARGEGTQTSGFTAMPIITTDDIFLTVMDSEGEVVWTQAVADWEIWRVQLALDHSGLLFNRQAHGPPEEGYIYKIDWEGTIEPVVTHYGLHSDFLELPDGQGYAFLDAELREFDHKGKLRTIMADRLIESDADGNETVVWDAFDSLTLDLDQVWPHLNYDWADGVEEWTHANGISYDADLDAYFISITELQAVARVNRNGDPGWVFSESVGDLSPGSEDTAVLWPHSVYAEGPDQVVVFNRQEYLNSGCSTVERYSVDQESRTFTRIDGYQTDDCLSIYFLGEARPVGEGALQVVWTTSGRVQQLDADLKTAWTLQSNLGAGIGYSSFVEDLYR